VESKRAEQPSHVDDWPIGKTQWQRVSLKYAWVDLIANVLLILAVAAVMAVFFIVSERAPELLTFIVFPSVLLALLLNALFAFRRVRAIGFVLREDDLLFRRGLLFERIVAVPYGRLQLVDVTRGPLLRLFGLTTLEFVTAAAAKGVKLPGLDRAEAEVLRDQLVSVAETRRSGL